MYQMKKQMKIILLIHQNGNVDDINTDNIQNPSENHENYLIKFKNNNKVLFILFIKCSLIWIFNL